MDKSPQKINLNTIKVDAIQMQKMVFIYNALEEGWNIEKRKDLYIFNKKHENKKEVYLDDYLRSFIEGNIDFNKIF
jgi:hypothetical protein|tara:strand:- start:15 stop:242 length:228 start_codon:yes stop_codon:yes gene_type:complete